VRIFDAVHVKVGQLLRVAIDKQTATGLQAKSFVEKGQLVPDVIVNNLVFARLQEPDVLEKGYVLEGYPRNRQQIIAMQQRGIIPDHASKIFTIYTSNF
jgi:adenylate kinase family enzyme